MSVSRGRGRRTKMHLPGTVSWCSHMGSCNPHITPPLLTTLSSHSFRDTSSAFFRSRCPPFLSLSCCVLLISLTSDFWHAWRRSPLLSTPMSLVLFSRINALHLCDDNCHFCIFSQQLSPGALCPTACCTSPLGWHIINLRLACSNPGLFFPRLYLCWCQRHPSSCSDKTLGVVDYFSLTRTLSVNKPCG